MTVDEADCCGVSHPGPPDIKIAKKVGGYGLRSKL